MAISKRRKSCKHGKLKKRVKTKSGGTRRCKKKRSRKSCKHGKLKQIVRTKSGGKRRCKKKRKLNPYFTFANKHRKQVMKDLKSKGYSGRDLIAKTGKELGKMYRNQKS
jgi:hypothetical protein